MAQVTIHDVYNALGLSEENGTQTLINAIRNSTDFADITSVYDGTVAGLNNFGVAVTSSPKRMNMFVSELVDRIGKVVISTTDLKNPLKPFKSGIMEYGRTVQEIHTDLIKAQSFNPEDAAETVFRREQTNTRVYFHDTWRKELYKQTIEEDELRHAFTNEGTFNGFVTSIFNAVYNSNEVDEYLWTKGVLEGYVGKGLATYVETVPVSDEASGKEFVKQTRANAKKLTLPQGSRNYNASGVHTRTPKERLWIMITADLDATLDVDVLAKAFNMDKANVEQQKIVVESFGVPGLEAVMFDSNIFKIYDKVFDMNSIHNPQGRYWNYNLHVHQLYSMSKLNNIVAFMSENIPAITRLQMTPVSMYAQVDKEKELNIFYQHSDVHSPEDFTFTVAIADDSGANVIASKVARELVDVTGASTQKTLKLTVKDETLVDQNLNVTVTMKETVEEGEGMEQSITSIVVPLPKTEARKD